MDLPAVAEELSLHRCLNGIIASRLNVLITKQSTRRQNIFNGSFCPAAALMRPGTPPLSGAAHTSAPIKQSLRHRPPACSGSMNAGA